MHKRFQMLAAAAFVTSWATATPLYAQGPADSHAQSANAKVLLGFKPGASAAARSAVAASGGRVAVDLSEVNGLAAEVPAGRLAALRRNPNVEFIEDDAPRHVLGSAGGAVRAPLALPGTPEAVPYGIGMVQADQVSDASAGNRKLCIIDSGIDISHEDLAGNVLTGANYSKSGQWYTDERAHGTHVAGTVMAVDNTVGVLGVLPHQRINLFIAKVFDASGSASTSVIVRAMLDCDAWGANVISMSLGGPEPTMLELRATEKLAQNNRLLIAAAGNDGDESTSYPAGFPDVVSVAAIDSKKRQASFSQTNADVELSAPGVDVLSTVPIGSQIAGSLTVGTREFEAQPMEGSPLSSASGPLADFGLGTTSAAGSMAGKVCLIQRGSITFAEKVVNCQNSGGVGAVIYNNTDGQVDGTLGTTVTTIPSVGVLQSDGRTLLRQLGQTANMAVFQTGDAYATFNGTSMATPHVSGVAALVWSHFPQCTATQIRDTLNKTAQDLGDRGRDPQFGFGLVQAKAAYDRLLSSGCDN